MAITARQVVGLVETHFGVPAAPDTIDQYLAGDPDQEVHGVATAMMATLDVLRRAAARGLDLVISHEPGIQEPALKARLRKTADDVGTPGWDRQTGDGRVNAFRALTEKR